MWDELLVILPVALVLGFLSGLGTGGGSLLILWLTLVLGMDQATARSINLMFFVPAALVACLFRWRQGKLEWSHVLPGILAGCASAWFFAGLGLETDLLKKLFGVLLLFTGCRELMYRKK